MSRRVLYKLLIVVGSFLLFISISEAKVLISKVQIAGSSTTDEYVELYNYSSSSVSLFGFSLKKLTSTGSQNTLVSSFPSTCSINPFGYFLVAHRDYSAVTPDFYYTNSSYNLATNNSVVLYDQGGTPVDEVEWGIQGGAPNPPAGTSLVRLPHDESGNYIDTNSSVADFIETITFPFNSMSPSRPLPQNLPEESQATTTENTPPLEEVLGGTTTIHWSDLKINEVMPYPATGSEWVELFNSGSSSIDLSGSTLCDNRSEGCTIANLEGIIQAGRWFEALIAGSKLNNDGDSVILKSAAGEIIDRIDYGSDLLPGKGQTIARIEDGSDSDSATDWSVTEIPTPGAANIIAAPPVPEKNVSYGGGGGGGGTIYSPVPTSESRSTTPKPLIVRKENVVINWKLDYPIIVNADEPTIFSAKNSADPRGGDIFYRWKFDDGEEAEGSEVSHVFDAEGIYQIEVSATSTQSTTGSKKFFIKVTTAEPIVTGIYLSEIMPNPAEGDEWVSLSSKSVSTTDLTGWKLIYNDKSYTIPGGTTLNPGAALRFFGSVTKFTFNNQDGAVALQSRTGEIVDIIAYFKSKKGESIAANNETPAMQSRSAKVLGTKITLTKATESKPIAKGLTIADAKSLPLASRITLTGTVRSLPGEPGTNYFYIGDNSGGTQIYSYKKSFPDLKIGDQVMVTGELGSFQNLLRVKTKSKDDIKIIASGAETKPEQKNIAEIDESDMGSLLTLSGEVTKLKTNYFYLDDGTAEAIVTLPIKANIDKKELHDGVKIVVIGIIDRTASGWHLVPRFPGDIAVATEEATPSSTEPVSRSNTVIIDVIGLVAVIALALLTRKMFFNK